MTLKKEGSIFKKVSVISSNAVFMLDCPQYCYAISLYIAAKLDDLTYPSPKTFLEICHSPKLSPFAQANLPFKFLKSLVIDKLIDLESEICLALGYGLSFKIDPNGD